MKTGFLGQQEQVAGGIGAAQPTGSASQSPRHEDHKAHGQQAEGVSNTLAPPPPYPGPPPPYPGAVQVRTSWPIKGGFICILSLAIGMVLDSEVFRDKFLLF